MLGTLTPGRRRTAKVMSLLWYTPITPRLPVDVEFGCQRGSLKGSPGESNYISQLRRRLKFAHRKAKHMAQKHQAKHRELHDLKCRSAALDVGDLVLVKQTAWKDRHKIQDRWESGEYQVVGQPTTGVPVYSVKSVAGAKPGSFTGIYYCPCKAGTDGQVGQWKRG